MKAIQHNSHTLLCRTEGARTDGSDTVQPTRVSRFSLGFLSIFGISIIMLAVVMSPMNVAAQPNAPLALPTRPPTPTPILRQARDGARIELRVTCEPNCASLPSGGIWTVVQWQDAWGAWHDVEGWRGALDDFLNGVAVKSWWVYNADLGKGPFRWQICHDECNKPLGVSASFNLPDDPNQVLIVEMTGHLAGHGGQPSLAFAAVPSASPK
jgi:hypothetical protein